MTGWWIALVAGATTGVLSGFGVGGGTILLLYMTLLAGVEQSMAQGINLLYYLFAALAALPGHIKHGFVEKSVAVPAIVAGVPVALVAAWWATRLDTALLHRGFGVLLLYIGLSQLWHTRPGQR